MLHSAISLFLLSTCVQQETALLMQDLAVLIV
jgi:hypothetical protein